MNVTYDDIIGQLVELGTFYSFGRPEFTLPNYKRPDYVNIDLRNRKILIYEIKMSRDDFLQDTKWQLYAEYASMGYMVCPEGLIQPKEIPSPFGLWWITKKDGKVSRKLKKRPREVQKRDSLAWIFTYLRVLEKEIPRMRYHKFGDR